MLMVGLIGEAWLEVEFRAVEAPLTWLSDGVVSARAMDS